MSFCGISDSGFCLVLCDSHPLQAAATARKKRQTLGMVTLTRPPFISRKDARRLTLCAPEPHNFGGRAFDKLLKSEKDDDIEEPNKKSAASLLDSTLVGKDASHLLN